MAVFDNQKGTSSDSFFIGKFSNKVFIRSNSGTIEVKNSGGVYSPLFRAPFWTQYKITAPFQAGEILDLATGTGSIAGTSSMLGTPANMILPANATLFRDSTQIFIYVNGVLAEKEVSVSWNSSTSLILADSFEVGEVLDVYCPAP